MFLLRDFATVEQVIKKSRFIAAAAPAETEDEARAFIARASDPAARHNCWAWRIGAAYRFSDDGEPGGTAGKPILQAIEGQEVDCVAVVVTRWFGGILLGTGGLVRAYGGTASACLRQAEKIETVLRRDIRLKIRFTDLSLVKARIAAVPGAELSSEAFQEDGAVLQLRLPENLADETVTRLIDETSGRLHLIKDENA